MIDDAFGHWFAGLFDGEGCFHIAHVTGPPGRYSVGPNGKRYGPYPGPRATSYRCLAQITLRADDVAIDEIAATLPFGVVTNRAERTKENANPQRMWTAQKKAACLDLVGLFDAYPLRSKKARDYAIWREAVVTWQTTSRGNGHRRQNLPVWERMEVLKTELMEVRTFR